VLAKRIIPCYGVTASRVVKGTTPLNLRDADDLSRSPRALISRKPTRWSSSTSPPLTTSRRSRAFPWGLSHWYSNRCAGGRPPLQTQAY